MSSQTNLFFEDKNLGLEQPDVNIETDTPSKQLFTKKNNDLYIKSYENSDDDFKSPSIQDNLILNKKGTRQEIITKYEDMTKNNREINTSNLYYPRSILNGNYIRCYNPLVAKDWCKPCQTDILSGNSEFKALSYLEWIDHKEIVHIEYIAKGGPEDFNQFLDEVRNHRQFLLNHETHVLCFGITRSPNDNTELTRKIRKTCESQPKFVYDGDNVVKRW
ncbi:11189_t:CDS:2 [Rhizophagus irregularis]|nr:11189_t:CDS:2 [Rhizophagus irregularis]